MAYWNYQWLTIKAKITSSDRRFTKNLLFLWIWAVRNEETIKPLTVVPKCLLRRVSN